jgi:asparagine synthetase B (glutamine-hydrolysing)
VTRFALVLEARPEGGGPAVVDALERARGALTLGGSLEAAFTLAVPGGGLLLLTHAASAPARLSREVVVFAVGHGPAPDETDERFLEAAEAWSRGGPVSPSAPQRALGRRALVRWEPGSGRVLVVTEANGLVGLYAWREGGRLVLASEPKAIAAIAGSGLSVSPDALVDLLEAGECLGSHTLWREIVALPPGTVVRAGAGEWSERAWHRQRFSERRGGRLCDAADSLNRTLREVLEAERRVAPRMAVALSGGMDSRYVLAGAWRAWPDVTAFSVGSTESRDVALARDLAASVGVPWRALPWDGDVLPAWAGYSTWRSDGMVGCLHAQGMDTVIAHAAGAAEPCPVLNGLGGDFLTGAFLRPGHLLGRLDAAGAARQLLALRHLHPLGASDLLRPEVLRECRTTPEESITAALRESGQSRPGNLHLQFWLRSHCARLTTVGLDLEAPFVDWATPLADPLIVAAVAEWSLEVRLLSRAYRAALVRLDARLAAIPWERYGIAPRLPAVAFAAAAVARRLKLVRRPWVRDSYAEALRGSAREWARETLLGPVARADGYLRPAVLEKLLGEHGSGAADHSAALGPALTIELWRRMFVGGDAGIALPPPGLPGARPAARIEWPPPGARETRT